MKQSPLRRATAIALCGAAAALAACDSGGGTAPSDAPSRAGVQPPVTAHSDYLALGDSVSFGYREAQSRPAPDFGDAADFTGFPEDVAADLHLHLANASCPGETSASLIDNSQPSHGCETQSTGSAPGYRARYPLHVSYQGSQLDYAVDYLRDHHDTRLVTLMIGVNDAFRCAETTADQCASEGPALLGRVRRNVATILGRLRGDGGYGGQIVLLGYYSFGSTTSATDYPTIALNRAMQANARRFRARVADGYAAFRAAAAGSGGDTCKAGLLNALTTGGCGVHPSPKGQRVLARAVEQAIDH